MYVKVGNKYHTVRQRADGRWYYVKNGKRVLTRKEPMDGPRPRNSSKPGRPRKSRRVSRRRKPGRPRGSRNKRKSRRVSRKRKSSSGRKRKPGRPRGSRNKRKSRRVSRRRKPGRPRGSRNKRKSRRVSRRRKPGRPRGSRNKRKSRRVSRKRKSSSGRKRKPGRPRGSRKSSPQKKRKSYYIRRSPTLAKVKPGDCINMSNLSKYRNRPGPPYPANATKCRGQVKLGNDGNDYISEANKKGVYRWKRL